MRESIQEHRSLPIDFSFEDRSKKVPHQEMRTIHRPFDDGSSMFTLPDISVVGPDSTSRRQAKQKGKRFCQRISCLGKLLLVLSVFMFYEEITSLLHMTQPPDISAPPIKRDYSSIKSVEDLNSDIVKPKCYFNINTCKCQDPLVPMGRRENPKWEHTHHHNTDAAILENIDVVFYGDSITEGWMGTSYGRPNRRDGESSREVFDRLFSTQNGGDFDGLTLGIAGDTSPNLLWRLKNGELPKDLNPSVFWLLIGTNDIGKTWCSPELVVIGIIRIVEEIRRKKPAATVVINGLTPRTFNKDGYVAKGNRLKVSMWEAIQAINDELRVYANYRDQIEFFETSVFFKDSKAPTSTLQIDQELMPDNLHPSAKGYLLWGEEIVAKLRVLRNERE